MYADDPNVGPGCSRPTPASTEHPGRQLQDGRKRRLAGGSATHDRAPRPTGSISNPYRRPRSMSGRQPRRCRGSACSRRRGTIPVILVDANLLVYAHVGSFAQHDAARRWLDGRLSGRAPVGLPWPSLLAFVRIVSNPRIFERPASVLAAWQQVESWLAPESTWIPLPTTRHREVLAPLMAYAEGRANLIPDAHLAALAVQHGLVLCSADGDFARFDGLRWINPLK